MEKKLRDMNFEETTYKLIKSRKKIRKLNVLGEWLSEETRKVLYELAQETQRLEDLDKHLNYRWHKEGLQQIYWQERKRERKKN